MTKYQKTYNEMIEFNKEIFENFKRVHQKFEKDPEKWRGEFNKKGMPVLDVIREYEHLLCGNTENSQFGRYSTGLSEKFWQLIRQNFHKIDEVGIE